MVVTTRWNGTGSPELEVGRENVSRYFPKRIPGVELQVGGLRIRCKLSDSFWRDRPVLRDARLSDWIRFAIFHKKRGGDPVLLEMIPLGEELFHLRPLEPGRAAALQQRTADEAARPIQSGAAL